MTTLCRCGRIKAKRDPFGSPVKIINAIRYKEYKDYPNIKRQK